MAIVKEFQHGNVKISIDDTYCKEQTEEEAKEIMDKVSEIICRALRAQYQEEELGKNKSLYFKEEMPKD